MSEEQKLVNEPEDIFADVDDSVTMTVMSGNSEKVTNPVIMDQHPMHKRMIWLGLILVVIILAGVGYYAYGKMFVKPEAVVPPNINSQNSNTKALEEMNNEVNNEIETNATVTPTSTSEMIGVPEPIVNKQVITDTDGDGLTDEEEMVLGTNINEPDTDGDGLFDREEVRVYKTNPLNPDSDGDGFTDGQEVKGGYNPNGDGKLFEFNIQQ